MAAPGFFYTQVNVNKLYETKTMIYISNKIRKKKVR